MLENRGFEYAAIEEHCCRMDKALARELHGRVMRRCEGFRLAGEKRGEMSRHAGILRVRQRDLREARGARGSRQLGDSDLGEKTVRQNAREFLSSQFRLDRPADQR